MRLLSYAPLATALVISLPLKSMAAEPYLLIEFEGTVTGNKFWCQETGKSCPTSNHFKAPTSDDSMVNTDFWGDVTGKVVVAYTRPRYTYVERTDYEHFEARVPDLSDFSFITGDVTFGARTFLLDRDYEWPDNQTLKDVWNIEIFDMMQSQGTRLSQLIVQHTAHSGMDDKTYDQERRLLRRLALQAQTYFNFELKFHDFEYGTKIFGNMTETSLPGFLWDRASIFTPSQNKLNLRLFDWSLTYSKSNGQRHREYTTTVEITLERVKVTSLNGKVPDQLDTGDREQGKPPGVPNPIQIQVD